MEELAEGVVRSALRLVGLAVRFVVALIWKYCFEILAWYVGWPICRLVTFGHYPKQSIEEYDKAELWVTFIVALVGFVFLVGVGALLAKSVGEI